MQYQGSNRNAPNTKYKHWNILYDNILKLRFEYLFVDLLDEAEPEAHRPGPRELTSEEWNQLFEESQPRMSFENHHKLNSIMVRTKILYSQPLGDQFSASGGGPNDDGSGLLGRAGDGQNIQQQSQDYGTNESLLSDLRVDCKDIQIGLKDLEQLHRVGKEIYKRSKQHLM